MVQPRPHSTASCTNCGGEYTQARSDQKYCSNRCSSEAWRKRKYAYTTLKCSRCGSDFIRKTSSQKYCARDCARATEAESKRRVGGPGKGWSGGSQKVPRRICQICGALFYAPPVQMRRGGGKFCSANCRCKHVALHPEMYPRTQTRRGKGGKRADLGGLYVRSTWEANWARYLNWLMSLGEILKWEYEAETFEFFSISRGTRFYTPDFRVTNKDGSIERHEVKGYMDDKSRIKLERMAKFYPEVKIILIDKAYYRSVANKVGKAIPGWEMVNGQASRNS